MSTSRRRILLVGWDAADWRFIDPLLERGEMPNLARLIEHGVMGNVASLSPMLSPMLWTSIATGKYADDHGILGFAEPDSTTGRARPVASTSRQTKAIWNILRDQGLNANVVNWFASHPAEPGAGVIVSDRFPHAIGGVSDEWPVPRGAIASSHAGDESELATLRVHPAATPRELIEEFVPDLDGLSEEQGKRVAELRQMLAQNATVHNAATWIAQSEDWDFLGVYFDAIDRFGHVFMEYGPPRMSHVSDDDVRRFGGVMDACYRWHDMMLGRLMGLAGHDVTVIVVSDHGFHQGATRPDGSSRIEAGAPVAWHRLHGMLVMAGPGIRTDERVYGASLLDLTPTMLALYGLPIGKDMSGTVLTQIFDDNVDLPGVTWIETWDDDAFRAARLERASESAGMDDPWTAHEMMKQLAGLGYVQHDDLDGLSVDRELALAQVKLSRGDAAAALECFHRAKAIRPAMDGIDAGIAQAMLRMGDVMGARAVVDTMFAADPDSLAAHLIAADIAERTARPDDARRHLSSAERHGATPSLLVRIGQFHLHQSEWTSALERFELAIDGDADNAEAWDGMGVALRHLMRREESVHAHMQAIALLHHRPQTHLNLGIVLGELGRVDWAIRAFETVIELAPETVLAHLCLAQLLEHSDETSGNVTHRDAARHHRGEVDRLRAARS